MLWRRLEYDFLAFKICALLLTFLFSFLSFLISLASRYVYLLRVPLCSSHLLISASMYFIVHVLSACAICTLPHFGIMLFFIRLVFFRSSYFSGGVFCSALVSGTLPLDLPIVP